MDKKFLMENGFDKNVNDVTNGHLENGSLLWENDKSMRDGKINFTNGDVFEKEKEKIIFNPLAGYPGYEDLDFTMKSLSAVEAENAVMKPYRMAVFDAVINLLNDVGIPYFIDCGTLLGAWRDNGKMIPRDIDTDVSIMEEDFETLTTNLHALPDHVTVDTRCCHSGVDWAAPENIGRKFNPGLRGTKKFVFELKRDVMQLCPLTRCGAMLDLYTYTPCEVNGVAMTRMNYALAHFPAYDSPLPNPFPLKRTIFEGRSVFMPNDPEKHLTEMYGYLGRDACWDKATLKYKKIPTSC